MKIHMLEEREHFEPEYVLKKGMEFEVLLKIYVSRTLSFYLIACPGYKHSGVLNKEEQVLYRKPGFDLQPGDSVKDYMWVNSRLCKEIVAGTNREAAFLLSNTY